MKTIFWHTLTPEEALERLDGRIFGLDIEEVLKRQKLYGTNSLPEAKLRTGSAILVKQLKNPLVYFLFGAVLLAFAIREMLDAFIIAGAVIISTVFGFFQEYKSEKAIAVLNKMIREVARVMRNGEEQKIDAEQLVPGDIIILQEGYKVPADARILEERNLEVDEALLTGESAPQSKTSDVIAENTPLAQRSNMIYTGTIIVRGACRAVVTAIGKKTEIGQIAESLAAVEHVRTPLEIKIERLSRNLSLAILLILTLVFILGITSGIPGKDMLLTSIALVAASVPEGLVVSVTAVLVVGMRRLMRENALVRNLAAVETVGQATVICADKTGTMTKARMEMAKVIPKEKALPERELLRIGMLTADARAENPQATLEEWRLTGDPTTRAILYAALEAGMAEEYTKRADSIIDDAPFESDVGYRAILVKEAQKNTMYFLGIPEKLVTASALSSPEQTALQNENKNLSESGFRVLGVAKKEISDMQEKLGERSAYFSNLHFLGFFALKDPLRESVKSAIDEARNAGIRVMMLTGDNKYTAAAIARDLGLPTDQEHLIDSIDAARMGEDVLDQKVRDLTVFARVTPRDKLNIVESLARQGEVVAMTGDGVNDAPALKRAHIGIALGSGQSVSREAADIVLLDDNFKTIVKGIEQGRGIFDNIRKVVAFLLYDSFVEVFLVASSILLHAPIPILPAQILWVNLVEDTFPAFALALEPREKDVMKQKPFGFRGNIIDRQLKTIIIGFGVTSALLLFGLFHLLRYHGVSIEKIRTIIFIGLTIDSLFLVFSLKSLRNPIWRTPLFNNPYIWMFFFGGVVFLGVPIYVPFFAKILRTVPLGVKEWTVLFALGFLNLIFLEAIKYCYIRMKRAIS